MTEQIPNIDPLAVEAEKSLLGAMMFSATAVADGLDAVNVEDFLDPIHRSVFMAIAQLANEDVTIDVQSVVTKMDESGSLKKLKCIDYVLQLPSCAGAGANAKYYAKIIRDNSVKRQLGAICKSFCQKSLESNSDSGEAMTEQAINALIRLIDRRKDNTLHTISQLNDEFMEVQKQLRDGTLNLAGIDTGFCGLDQIIHGMRPGNLVLIAARPGVGKTAFTLAILLNQMSCKRKVLFISLEMPKEEIQERIFSRWSRLPVTVLRDSHRDDAQWQQILEANRELNKMANHFWISESANTLSQIYRDARRLSAKEGIDLIAIDYLQLISGVRAENRNQEVGKIARALKKMAIELHCPIIALSQLNRGLEARADKTPTLADLRDSGELEQAADIVMLMYAELADTGNPTDYLGVPIDAEIMNIIVAKHRQGPVGRTQLSFDPGIMMFQNL